MDVPLDTALAIHENQYGTGGESQFTVTLTEAGSDAELAGTTTIRNWDFAFVHFKPTTALRANTQYRARVDVTSPGERPTQCKPRSVG